MKVCRRGRNVRSLHSPALDIERGMGDISIYAHFENLGELYAPSTSGVRLLQDFFRMIRKPGESLIDQLQRLSVTLDKVVKRGGLQTHLVNECPACAVWSRYTTITSRGSKREKKNGGGFSARSSKEGL